MNNRSNLVKYRILAPIYDFMMGNRLFTRARKRAFALLNLKSAQRVLLIGVGTGEDLAFFETDADIYGIDLSEDMLKRARQKVGSRNISLLRMNAEAMTFKDADFDVIIMNLILSVVEDPVRAAGEAVRVLKPSGKMLVFDKFLPVESSPSWPRKLLNRVTSLVGTDINRKFEDMVAGLPLRALRKTSLLRGSYQIIILEKAETFES